MPLPNFFIIGAAKAGTTSLYEYCRQHPDIFVPEQKEPRFFRYEGESIDPADPVNQQAVTDFRSYLKLFDTVTSERAIGEASGYLTSRKACEGIKKRIPDAKLIVILRHPVDRAYSHFLFSVQKGFEPASATFEDAITHPTVRVGDWVRHRPYVHNGFYHRHLTPWFEEFPAEQLKVCLFEDLTNAPVMFAQEIYRFLGVDDEFVPETSLKYAKSGLPRSSVLHHFLNRPGRIRSLLKRLIPYELGRRIRTAAMNRNLHKPKLSPHLRRRLLRVYHDDILRLQDRIERDLSEWTGN